MKITYVLRQDGGLYFGGAEVQAMETAAAVRRLGVEAEILTPHTREVGDLVHAFGHYPSHISMLEYCHKRGIPFVLSTIFYKDYLSRLQLWRDRWRATRRHNPMHAARRLMRGASALLPNTEAEARQVSELFLSGPVPIHVVPNGAEERFAHGDPALFRQHFGIHEPFVLNVARVEKRKNQLRLIEAVKGSGMKLVILGKESQDGYSQACRELAGDDPAIVFLPPIPHDDPLLASAYAAARVFALPSRLETPGIAALEAGIAGARVVVTPVGGAREYFGDDAWYPDAHSAPSIRAAVQAAWNAQRDDDAVRRRLLHSYTWDAVGRQTVEVYRQVLAARASQADGGAR